MKLFIYIFLASNLIGQVAILHDLEPGKRDNSYRVWIYFDERDQNRIVDLDPKSIKRRKKHDIHTPTKYDYKIKQSYLNTVKKTGAEIKNKSRWLNAVSVIANMEQINFIQGLSYVTKVEPVYQHRKKKATQSAQENDQNRNLDYGASLGQIEQINCHIAHTAGYYGQGVRVLYLDTGYELNHEA